MWKIYFIDSHFNILYLFFELLKIKIKYSFDNKILFKNYHYL